MSTADLILGEADIDDDEENEESFDEETGEPKARKGRSNGHLDDSSEEEDDEDEEAAAEIRDGFIVDDEEGDEEKRQYRKKLKKRRRAEEEEAVLDDEDFDLIGEANPEWERKAAAQPKLKRLKRGHREDNIEHRERGLDQIFSDDEENDGVQTGRPDHVRADEFADFIEDDEEDEETRARAQEQREVARPRDRGYVGGTETTGLDKDALEDMEAIFGNGEDYDWALALEDEAEIREAGDHNLELKDVFEPSQLAERLLTDEDNAIRWADEPERFQLDRAPYKHLQATDEQVKEEARWISTLMWPKKQAELSSEFHGPFVKAISKVLEFFVTDDVEVPYVFQHRKDYLIYARRVRTHRGSRPEEDVYEQVAEKLLVQDDLWRILELDLRFRALIDKRNTLERTYDNLKLTESVNDPMVEELLHAAATMEELQDVQDYIYFQYASEIKSFAATNTEQKEKRRPGGKSGLYDRLRKSKTYSLVTTFGISPDQLGKNALKEGKAERSEDPSASPIDIADSLVVGGDFDTGDQVLNAARQMVAEQIFMSPRMRKFFRIAFYMSGVISCHRTEKGLRKIDEQHPYYELKYLKNQTFSDIARKPEIFLQMMKAEEDGLVEIQVHLQNEREIRRNLLNDFASDNYSELADAWNEERQEVLDLAFPKLARIITKGVKDSLRTECHDQILKACRASYLQKLDQAPFKPADVRLGETSSVLALSNGGGDPNREPVHWILLGDDGRVLENGRFENLLRDERAQEQLAETIRRIRPDALAVSGFSAATHRLITSVKDLISDKGLGEFEKISARTGEPILATLKVTVVNDEVARLYKDSPRAAVEHPTLPPLSRYCVALARYMQSPLKEYAALGKDIISLSFHPCQQLLPEDKLRKHLDTAMVDLVNLCGVEINDAFSDPYTAALLPYVCGLGPRKATAVLKTINTNGGSVNTRDELVGDPDNDKLPVVGPRVWNNCASFLYIDYDESNPVSDYLDNTRVHPEDYELGRKMAADALELDEEDVKAEVDVDGPGAIVRKLIADNKEEMVNDLILEEYAEQLETNYNQRKRATLETIRAELQQPYEELRRDMANLSTDEIFTMLTGETRESLCQGMIVSVNMRVVKEDFAIVKLDSGIEGRVEHADFEYERDRNKYSVGQTAHAKIIELDRVSFTARLTLRDSELATPYRKRIDHEPNSWDFVQEAKDKEELREKDKATGRTQRVVKHPLFRPFNSTQAEQYLGSQSAGDAVIRPSSKGNDHLAVTWKVADGIYQHIDVLEMQKENDFSVGKILRIGQGGKYSYSDLDELIVDHVKAMAKKVDEMMQHEKFQAGSKAETEKWLTTYTEANPKRSVYAFCLDSKHPGYFHLCFKAGQGALVNSWPVRVVPNAFEMMKSPYPDMRALCNGFKLRHQGGMGAGRR